MGCDRLHALDVHRPFGDRRLGRALLHGGSAADRDPLDRRHVRQPEGGGPLLQVTVAHLPRHDHRNVFTLALHTAIVQLGDVERGASLAGLKHAGVSEHFGSAVASGTMCGDGCTIGRVSRPATASTASATGRGTTASPRGAWYRRRDTGSSRSTSCTSNRRFTTPCRAGDADRRPLREPLDHVEARGCQPRVDAGDCFVGEPEPLPDLLRGRVVVVVGRRGVVHTIDEGIELGFAGERQDEIELDAFVRRSAAENGSARDLLVDARSATAGASVPSPTTATSAASAVVTDARLIGTAVC